MGPYIFPLEGISTSSRYVISAGLSTSASADVPRNSGDGIQIPVSALIFDHTRVAPQTTRSEMLQAAAPVTSCAALPDLQPPAFPALGGAFFGRAPTETALTMPLQVLLVGTPQTSTTTHSNKDPFEH